MCGAASFATVACAQAAIGKSLITVNASGLTIGTTYYILVDDYSINTGTFQLCLSNFAPSATPVNDPCSGAIALCQGQTYQSTTTGATANSITDPPLALWNGCTTSIDKSVYFTFTTSVANAPVTIDILPNCTGSAPLVAGIFKAIGAPCVAGNWTAPISCFSGSVTNVKAGFTINTGTALTGNTTCY